MELVDVRVLYTDASSILGRYVDNSKNTVLSRYRNKSIINDNGSIHYASLSKDDLTIKTENYSKYVVKSSEVEEDKELRQVDVGTESSPVMENEVVVVNNYTRLDILAKKFYGDASLYWAICYFNDILDPMDVPVGTVLKIPSKLLS